MKVTQLETPGCCFGWVEVGENGQSVFGRLLRPSLLVQQAQRQGTQFLLVATLSREVELFLQFS